MTGDLYTEDVFYFRYRYTLSPVDIFGPTPPQSQISILELGDNMERFQDVTCIICECGRKHIDILVEKFEAPVDVFGDRVLGGIDD